MSFPKTPKEVLAFAREHDVKMVDLRFTDLLGTWQHISHPIHQLTEDSFEDGFGFDGSSIRGWQPINQSDMIIRPDPSTARIDPILEHETLVLICNVFDPITKAPYSRDPRYVSQKAENYLKSTGIGDVVYVGPEAEFFVFTHVAYEVGQRRSFYEIDSDEAHWNSGSSERPNLGHRVRAKEGYFPCPPVDTLQDLRTEMCLKLEQVGITVEAQHHEVATAGQCEIDMRFDTMTPMADKVQWYKYIVKNVARQYGYSVTFMPKPLFGDNGSGMHTHQSIWKGGTNLFAGDGYGGLSAMAMNYIGGILKHAPAMCAITNPTTNSYKRLVPGYEAPVNLAYSSRNRSASIRIPMLSSSPKAKRIEFRTPDPSCNPYLSFAIQLMAGLDGVQGKFDAGDPLDKDIYSLSPEELKSVPKCPGALDEALSNLEKAHGFALKGDVITQDLIDMWLEYKREKEVDAVRLRPHPMEYHLYYDC
ncbi:MAG: Glutamine synthetase [Myxococcota bacterium]|nr:Glutamine synthetase [Myxococcota bacterium]